MDWINQIIEFKITSYSYTAHIMGMKQMMACLLAVIRTGQEHTKEMMKAMQDKMDNGQEEMKAQLASLTSWIDVNQVEMNAKMDATKEKMDAWIAEMKDGRKKEMMACQEATESYPGKVETSPEETESEAEHEKVPKNTAVKLLEQ
jgi:hypothetical protein